MIWQLLVCLGSIATNVEALVAVAAIELLKFKNR